MGSRWSVFKIFSDALKTSSSTLLLKIGNKSFHDLAPVYEIDFKPYVVVFFFGCSTFTGFINEYLVDLTSNGSIYTFGI